MISSSFSHIVIFLVVAVHILKKRIWLMLFGWDPRDDWTLKQTELWIRILLSVQTTGSALLIRDYLTLMTSGIIILVTIFISGIKSCGKVDCTILK